MKSRRRVSFKLILLTVFFLSVFAGYLHFGLLPGRLKNRAIAWIQDATGKKVRFDKLLFLPFRGLSFYNIKVMDEKSALLFSARRLSANVKLLSFLRDKKIIFSNLELDTPLYDFLLEPAKPEKEAPPLKTKISGQIPVPVIPEKKKLDLPENVYLEQIHIVNGRVTVRQRSRSGVLENLSAINVRMGFEKPPELKFDGSFKVGNQNYAAVTLKGRWNLEKANYEFYLETKADKIPAWLLDYQKNNFVILKNARVLLNTHLKSVDEESVLFHTEAGLKEARLALKQTEYSGNMTMDADGVFNFPRKSFDRYKGTLELEKVDVSSLTPEIRRLENVSGKINFEPDLLTLDSASGRFGKLRFEASGSLKSFKEFLFSATVQSRSDVQSVLSLLPPAQKKFLQGFEAGGSCAASTTLQGSLKNPSGIKIGHELVISNGFMKNSSKKINLTDVSGKLTVDEAGIHIAKSRFTADKKTFGVSIFIPKHKETPGEFNLESEEFRIAGRYTFDHETVLLQQASAETQGLRASFQGKLFNIENPFLDIQGETEIILEQIKPFLAAHAPALKDAGLRGRLSGVFTLKGRWNDVLNWNLNMDAKSDRLFIHDKVHLDNFEIQLRMANRIANVPYYHVSFYDGVLGGTVFFDLSQGTPYFDGRAVGQNVNLNALVHDLEFTQKNFAGVCLFQTTLKGTLGLPQTYTGQGSVDVREGNLWKTSLFKQMGELPFLKISGLDLVIFRSLSGTFLIQGQRVWTDNLHISSQTVNVSLNGSVGFDQTLDMLMSIQYSSDVIQGAFQTGGLVPFVVQQAEDFISQYKISGTLKEPRYEKTGIPGSRAIGKKVGSLIQALVR